MREEYIFKKRVKAEKQQQRHVLQKPLLKIFGIFTEEHQRRSSFTSKTAGLDI